jgi:predicted ester cyclase
MAGWILCACAAPDSRSENEASGAPAACITEITEGLNRRTHSDSMESMNGESRNKNVVATINAVLSGSQSVDALDSVVAADLLDHAAFPGQRAGREGFKNTVQALRAAFDQQVSSLHTVAEADLVIDHWISRGIHRGAFMGMPPTGRPTVVEGFSVWRLSEGKAVEAWGLVDIAGLMRQLKPQ